MCVKAHQFSWSNYRPFGHIADDSRVPLAMRGRVHYEKRQVLLNFKMTAKPVRVRVGTVWER